jgi:hypothetical protein
LLKKSKQVIGWIEWVSLPGLKVKKVKAKADTGARTSALHAENIRIRTAPNGHKEVTFTFYPEKDTKKHGVRVTCPLKESRLVKSSTGIETLRPVISTVLRIGAYEKKIELTLINRSPMEFRMLLGRRALRDFLVDPRHAYLISIKGSHK